jgi:hypothetical protein
MRSICTAITVAVALVGCGSAAKPPAAHPAQTAEQQIRTLLHAMVDDLFNQNWDHLCAAMTGRARDAIPPAPDYDCPSRMQGLGQSEAVGRNAAAENRAIDKLSITIDADSAEAVSPGNHAHLHFVRRGGRWYLDFVPGPL